MGFVVHSEGMCTSSPSSSPGWGLGSGVGLGSFGCLGCLGCFGSLGSPSFLRGTTSSRCMILKSFEVLFMRSTSWSRRALSASLAAVSSISDPL